MIHSGAMASTGCVAGIKVVKTIPLSTGKLGKSGASCVCVRPDEKIFATGGWDCKLRVFHWKKLEPLAVLEVCAIHYIYDSEASLARFFWLGSPAVCSKHSLFTGLLHHVFSKS